MIPKHIAIKNHHLPPTPGVYFMKDAAGKLLYIGKATSLKMRVSSYFVRPADARIAKMVTLIAEIDYQEVGTVIEALLLEAKLIKKFQPPYNVMEKDDRSWVYLVFTAEPFPRPLLMREHELLRLPKKQFIKTFGPFRSAVSVQSALDALRRSFPWSTCKPPTKKLPRPCFYRHLGLCAGVCTGDITSLAYKKMLRGLFGFFVNGRERTVSTLRKQMSTAAKEKKFEEAATLRDRLYHLEHIRDIVLLQREHSIALPTSGINIFGRIEGYDISNISGQHAVGSMIVFVDGEAKKSEYRQFHIQSVTGPNDIAMLAEVLRRRFSHESWPLPDILLIDGGVGQVNIAKQVLEEYHRYIPIIGIAKGPDRKQDELVFNKSDHELARLSIAFKTLLQRVRDEAHRFAVSAHRKFRAKNWL